MLRGDVRVVQDNRITARATEASHRLQGQRFPRLKVGLPRADHDQSARGGTSLLPGARSTDVASDRHDNHKQKEVQDTEQEDSQQKNDRFGREL